MQIILCPRCRDYSFQISRIIESKEKKEKILFFYSLDVKKNGNYTAMEEIIKSNRKTKYPSFSFLNFLSDHFSPT